MSLYLKVKEQVPEVLKKERLAVLNDTQMKVSENNNERYMGYSGIVHVEGCDSRKKNLYYGKYSNFKMVYFESEQDVMDQYLTVEVTGSRRNALTGRLVKQ